MLYAVDFLAPVLILMTAIGLSFVPRDFDFD